MIKQLRARLDESAVAHSAEPRGIRRRAQDGDGGQRDRKHRCRQEAVHAAVELPRQRPREALNLSSPYELT